MALSQAREEQVRSEEKLDALRARRAQIVGEIEEALNIAPTGLIRLANLAPDAPMPDRREVERTLDEARRERERLGAVNLRAEDEQKDVQTQLDGIDRRARRPDRGDQAPAPGHRAASTGKAVSGCWPLSRWSTATSSACSRPCSAAARPSCSSTESDDPLEAGLEIMARPPGKKPQTLTLLSGGEQALTAIALIFAVFLTNPAPICVLDEVDAPLDDANVERFCDLLDDDDRSRPRRASSPSPTIPSPWPA